MKKKVASILFVFAITTFTYSCSKDNDSAEESANCKTCRALATNTKPEKVQKVCSEAEQAAFTSAHQGQEITCR